MVAKAEYVIILYMNMKDGLNLEKILGRVDKDKYHKATLAEVKHIPESRLEHMDPKDAFGEFEKMEHDDIRKDIGLCYKIARDSQSWSNPARPLVPFPYKLLEELDKLLIKEENFPSFGIKYFTAIKPEVIKDANRNDDMNFNRTHLDVRGRDAWFEITVEEDVETEKDRIIRIPFDLTERDKPEKDPDIFVMKVTNDLDFDISAVWRLKTMKEQDFIDKHVIPQVEKLFEIFKKKYALEQFDIA